MNSWEFSRNFTYRSRSRVIFISLSLLKKEWKQNLFTLHFSKKSESQNFSLFTSRIKVKAYFFHFSLLELFKPTLAGAWFGQFNPGGGSRIIATSSPLFSLFPVRGLQPWPQYHPPLGYQRITYIPQKHGNNKILYKSHPSYHI